MSIDLKRFEPSPSEKAAGMITKNACQCKLCGAGADRYSWGFQCQANSGHQADLVVCIFSDLTHPGEVKEKSLSYLGISSTRSSM